MNTTNNSLLVRGWSHGNVNEGTHNLSIVNRKKNDAIMVSLPVLGSDMLIRHCGQKDQRSCKVICDYLLA